MSAQSTWTTNPIMEPTRGLAHTSFQRKCFVLGACRVHFRIGRLSPSALSRLVASGSTSSAASCMHTARSAATQRACVGRTIDIKVLEIEVQRCRCEAVNQTTRGKAKFHVDHVVEQSMKGSWNDLAPHAGPVRTTPQLRDTCNKRTLHLARLQGRTLF